jgi:trigger factor
LGLVLAELGRVNGVEVKDEEVGRAIQAEASRYPGQERQVYEFFQKNPNAVASLRAPLYEEKVVDFVLQLAKVTDVTVTRAELESEDDVAPAAEAKPAKKAPAKAKAKKEDAPAEAAPAEAAAEEKPAPKKKAPSKKKAD